LALKDSFRVVADLLPGGRMPRLWLAALALTAAAALAAGAGVGSDRGSSGKGVDKTSRSTPVGRVSFLAKLIPPPAERSRATGPRVPRSIDDLARRLPLERQVAQLLLVGFRGHDLTADVFRQLRRLDLGGLVIDRGNYKNPQLLGQMAGEAVVISQKERHVPPLVMADQPGGEFNAFPDLAPADAPADLKSAGAGGAEAAESAAILRALGVTGVLAPELDVGTEDDPALGARVYSDDPEEVAGFADATVKAYRRARVLAAAAHFPGLGSASQPTSEGPAQVGLSLGALRRRDLVPFRAAFESGVPAVVLSHALYAIDDFTLPGSLSKRVATGLLRTELGFRGLAITDDLADPAITDSYSVPDAAVAAIKAGADMLYVSGPPGDQQAAYVALLRAAQRREIPRRRLEEAVSRVLIAKRQYGLIR
jgi:beta-N-acetylhexosaminidase